MSKKASELWRNLSAQDRLHWDKEAAKEKERYTAEKELYKGPVSYLIFISICSAYYHVVFQYYFNILKRDKLRATGKF